MITGHSSPRESHDSPPGLGDKRVMVTGGASGIGLEVARAFDAAGARVHVCDVDAEALAELADRIPAISRTRADVSRPREVEVLFEEAQASLGGLDVLINNVGISGPAGPIEDLSLEDWRRTLAANLDSCFYCARLAVPLLKRQGGGSIVNMSSTAGLFGCPLRSPYAAAKWGVVGLTKTLAMELGAYGIRVNAICPGSVGGDRIERVIASEATVQGTSADRIRDAYLRQSSMRTFVSAGDVAELTLFLCSDAGARISGQALAVDGNTESLGVNC